MRIRRRGSGALSQAPDLSLHLQAPSNGRQEADDKPGGKAPGLHPDVDLPVDPHHGCTNKAMISSSPSNPASQLSGYCIPSLDPSLVKELGEKQQLQVLEEKVDVVSNKLCVAQLAQVNSNKREEKKAKTKATTTSSSVYKDAVRVLDGSTTVKKRKSPAVLMEGSRCSRVNGRGWRCCQQTLVGYSLCEHHLGKGRLKTMTSVRGQLGSTRPIKPNSGDQAENGFKKSKKIGMVKARSINSLLGDKNKNHSLAILSTTTASTTTTTSSDKAATA